MKNTSASEKPSRIRNFATMIYPESAIDGWQQIIDDLHIPCFVSPLHDKDKWTKDDELKNPEHKDGELKKPHYHVMFMFEGKKSLEQIQAVVDAVGGVGIEPVNSLKSYSRYLCHLDSPEKELYNIEDVKQYGGALYTVAIDTVVDKYQAIADMIDFCEVNEINDYADLIVWCRSTRFEWFKVLCDSGTNVIKEYMKSRTWSKQKGGKRENSKVGSPLPQS